MAERKEHFPYFRLPRFDLKDLVPRNPRAILADLAIAFGMLSAYQGIKTIQDTMNAPTTPIPQSRSIDIPPTATPYDQLLRAMTPTEVIDLERRITTATTTPKPPDATATPTGTPSPTPTETPTGTATATATRATRTSENNPCRIFSERYCSQAELVERQTALGLTVRMIGVHVRAGEPLPMPIKNGQVSKSKLNETVVFYKGNRAIIFDPENPKRRYIYTGAIGFPNMLTLNMKEGEVFGYTQDTDIDMLGFNFVFYVADIGPDNREIINEEEMKRLIPEAYANSIRKAAALPEISTNGGTIYINTFYDAPPK